MDLQIGFVSFEEDLNGLMENLHRAENSYHFPALA